VSTDVEADGTDSRGPEHSMLQVSRLHRWSGRQDVGGYFRSEPGDVTPMRRANPQDDGVVDTSAGRLGRVPAVIRAAGRSDAEYFACLKSLPRKARLRRLSCLLRLHGGGYWYLIRFAGESPFRIGLGHQNIRPWGAARLRVPRIVSKIE